MSKKIIKNELLGYNYRKFAQFYELIKFIIGMKGLVIAPFRFLRSKIFFRICFVIWYELFPTYLVEKIFSKKNLFFSNHKMLNVKYCKVQISNELSSFYHLFLILSQLLTMPKKGNTKSINVPKKWKQWYIMNKSKTSIVLSYHEFQFHIISLSIILCFLENL